MKGNLPKVIILLVMVFLAYKSLGHGIKSLISKPAATTPSEEALVEIAPEELLSPEQKEGSSSATEPKADILTALNDYKRVPFFSAQESKSEKDVTDAPASRSTADEIPQLTTILNYKGRWLAIINGNLVKEGDKIGTIRVLEIKEDLVKIEQAGKIYQLKLWRESISK